MLQVTKHRGPEPDDKLGDLYHVIYDDGDAEDLNSKEVKQPGLCNLDSSILPVAQVDTLAHPQLFESLCDDQLEQAMATFNHNELYPLVKKKVSISTGTKKEKEVTLFGENRAGSPIFSTVRGFHVDGCVSLLHVNIFFKSGKKLPIYSKIFRMPRIQRYKPASGYPRCDKKKLDTLGYLHKLFLGHTQ